MKIPQRPLLITPVMRSRALPLATSAVIYGARKKEKKTHEREREREKERGRRSERVNLFQTEVYEGRCAGVLNRREPRGKVVVRAR